MWLYLLLLVLFSAVFAFLSAYLRKSARICRFALPDYLPPEEQPDSDDFGKTRAYYAGSFIFKVRVIGLPVAVFGRGFGGRGSGVAWLASEALVFRRYLIRKAVIIPYGIIHRVEVKPSGFFGGKLITRRYLRIVWGRKELPVVSAVSIAGGSKKVQLWAEEIILRADAWKKKLEQS